MGGRRVGGGWAGNGSSADGDGATQQTMSATQLSAEMMSSGTCGSFSFGAAAPAAFGPAFGPQGEGVIEGHYTDYERPRLHEHGGRRFGRFACGAGCNASSCAVADASEV